MRAVNLRRVLILLMNLPLLFRAILFLSFSFTSHAKTLNRIFRAHDGMQPCLTPESKYISCVTSAAGVYFAQLRTLRLGESVEENSAVAMKSI
jgi:hypothetical protein